MTEQPCCPNPDCRSFDIHRRVRHKSGYRCNRCSERFEQPAAREREGENGHGGISALGKAALAADPEDVP